MLFRSLSRRLAFCVVLAFCSLAPASAWAQQSDEQLAAFYFQNKEFDKAAELYVSLLDRTQSQFYYSMLLRSYLELDRLKEAERLVERRLKQRPSQLELWVDLGEVWRRRGEEKRMLHCYEEAVGRLGRDTKQVSNLAEAFVKADRPDWAAKVYLTARQRSGNSFLYVMELAALYERMGDYEGMMREYFDLLDSSPGSMGSIQISLQRALQETSNPKLAEGLRKTLVSRVQQQPGNNRYLEMMIWFSIQQKDFAFALTQAKAVDARFAEDGGQQVFRVAQIARNNGDFATAAEGFDYIVRKGSEHALYFDCRVQAMQVAFDRLNGNYALPQAELSRLLAEYDAALTELGKGVKTVPLMRNYAHLLAYEANRLQEASDLLYDVLDLPRLAPQVLNEVKLELGDLLLFAGEVWDASLLYSQVEKANKNDVLGALAKFKNARLSYYNHDFLWAKSQLDVLRASTSKLIANDAMELSLLISDNMEADSSFDMLELYASADLLLYRNRLEEAWEAFDGVSKRALSHPLFDEVLMQKARIRMRQGRFAEADSLLQKIVDFYPTDITADDALMMLAELNEDQLHNPVRAKECYEKLILDYPVSLYVERARKRYNALR